MKDLPNNMENLNLFLSINNLGANANNLKQLAEGMKYFPKNL